MPSKPTLTADDINQIKRLIVLHRDLLERDARKSETIDSVAYGQQLIEIAVREGLDEVAEAVRKLADRIKRLEEIDLLNQLGNEGKVAELRKQTSNEHHIEYLEQMLIEVSKKTQFLQLKKAKLGYNFDFANERELEELLNSKLELEAQLVELKNGQKKK